jgi:hypothetical protein
MIIESSASTFPLEGIGSDGCLCGLPDCLGHPAVTDEDGQRYVEFTRDQYGVIRAKRAKTDKLTDSQATKA